MCVCVSLWGFTSSYCSVRFKHLCTDVSQSEGEAQRKGTDFHLSGRLFRNIWCPPDAKMASGRPRRAKLATAGGRGDGVKGWGGWVNAPTAIYGSTVAHSHLWRQLGVGGVEVAVAPPPLLRNASATPPFVTLRRPTATPPTSGDGLPRRPINAWMSVPTFRQPLPLSFQHLFDYGVGNKPPPFPSHNHQRIFRFCFFSGARVSDVISPPRSKQSSSMSLLIT